MATAADDPGTPQFVAYPRGDYFQYGSVEQLQALADGYFGLTNVFLLNVVLSAVALSLSLWFEMAWGILLIVLANIGVCVAVGYASYPSIKKIGFGANLPPATAAIWAAGYGATAWLLCGFVGFKLIHVVALREMRKYGLKVGTLSLRREYVKQEVARRCAQAKARPLQFQPSEAIADA